MFTLKVIIEETKLISRFKAIPVSSDGTSFSSPPFSSVYYFSNLTH
jgi:hypothetical protein